MRYRFSAEALPVTERFPYWREVICPEYYSLTPDRCPDAVTFTAWNDFRDAGRFGLAQSDTSVCGRSRSASDIAQETKEYVTLYHAKRDAQSFDFDAGEIILDAGDMCMVSTTQRFKSCSRDGLAFRTLIVPTDFLAPLVTGGSPRGPFHLRSSTPIGKLLGASLDSAWSQMLNISEDLGEAILANVAALLAVACGTSKDGTSVVRHSAAQLRSDLILRHIERHLAEPGLTPDHAARSLGISTRQVHALLEPSGETFARHVTRRRLEACRIALKDPAFSHRSVTDIALGWGFNSLATFYRAFRAAYGVAPGDLRATSSEITAD